MITERGYKCVYLPPYSPELNPIEQFWSIIKNSVRRSQLQEKEDLATRITEACNSVPREHLKAFVQHSANVFEVPKGRIYLINFFSAKRIIICTVLPPSIYYFGHFFDKIVPICFVTLCKQ